MGLTVRGSSPGGGEIFRVSFRSGPGPFPAPWPRDLFAGCKAAEAWLWPPTPSNAEVEERVQLYVCTPFWAFMASSVVYFTFTKIANR